MNINVFLCVLIAGGFQFCKSEDPNCIVCHPRTIFLLRNIEECTCSGSKFCEKTTGECQDCGDCFKSLKAKLDNATVQTFVLLTRANENYQKLKDQIASVAESIAVQEGKIVDLNASKKNIGSDINTSNNFTKYLETKLEELEELADNIKVINSSSEQSDKLQDLISKVEDLLQELQNLKVEPVSEQDVEKVISEINTIRDNIQDLDIGEAIDPKLLNMAHLIEEELSLLNNNLITTVDYAFQYLPVENALLKVLEVLFNLGNIHLDSEELQNNATLAMNMAEKMEQNLQKLLNDESKFQNTLSKIKNEVDFYRELTALRTKLQKLLNDTDILNRFINKPIDSSALQVKFEEFKRNFEKYKDQIKFLKKNEDKIKELLSEKQKLVERRDEFRSPAAIKTEIDALTKEVNDIKYQLDSHCTAKKSTG